MPEQTPALFKPPTRKAPPASFENAPLLSTWKGLRRPPSVSFTIEGEAASKANSRRNVGKRFIKSEKALGFETIFLAQLPPAAKVMFEGPVQVSLRMFYASNRPDLDESLVLDLMQAKTVGTGKNCRVVRPGVYINDRQVHRKVIDWGLDPLRPRVEVQVQPLEMKQ